MDLVRVAVIGLGSMGSSHARAFLDGRIPGARLAAVCDADSARLAAFPGVASFTDHRALITSGVADAVVIATPHPFHARIGVDTLDVGLHTLVEKPLAVHVADARRLVAAHERHPELAFALMVNQRTDPRYRTVKRLLTDGELGAVHRISWTITDWFRTDAYYRSSSWRATWAGEGGGVLVNQCPHQLDLWCWLFGRPDRVRAFCQLGRWHDLEVEDACTAYLEQPGGATGVFITTTGEAPGTNRLEVATDRGRVVVDDVGVVWDRTAASVTETLRTAPGPFDAPAVETQRFPIDGWGGQHEEILANFVAAITRGEPLIGPGADGLAAVELGNAMLLSSLWDRTLDLPLDPGPVEAEYERLARDGRPSRAVGTGVAMDLSGSFGSRPTEA